MTSIKGVLAHSWVYNEIYPWLWYVVEFLQDRDMELEELFQYYLDLNPTVHHDVLHHVIRDIRTELHQHRTYRS